MCQNHSSVVVLESFFNPGSDPQLTANRTRESLGEEGGSVGDVVVLLPVEDRSSAGIAPPLSPVTQDLFRPP